jgi:O-acetyl-ADP-ribose deacetylase (regulator of RNase III)
VLFGIIETSAASRLRVEWMPSRQMSDHVMRPELDAIATAAAERLRAEAGADAAIREERRQSVADAASAAIRAGAALAAIAEAERIGEARARAELRTDILRNVERAARRKREADADCDYALARAARIGLSHRDIAMAAGVTHSTVRAAIARIDANRPAAEPAEGTEG